MTTKESWQLVKTWKRKRQGNVWIVKNSKGITGYFKYTTQKHWFYSGTMVANEYIAAALAKKLGFPVARLNYATVPGPNGIQRTGVVSVAVSANEVVTWRDAPSHIWNNPENYVESIELLSQLVVFDAWITNIDRAPGKNLILYRNDSGEKYKWYLIDHGHTLYGSPRKWKRGAWNRPIWQRLWQFYNVPRGLLRLQSNPQILEAMIRKIEGLSESEIDQAIRSTPKVTLKYKEKKFVKQLLITRQQQIRKIINQWIQYKGTREFGTEV